MGTKCTQSSKSRKIFGSVIQRLTITASNSPTEYLLDALILANLERRTWLWWKSNGICCFVYFFFRQNLRWWRWHHVINYHPLCISFRRLKRTTLQTHFLQQQAYLSQQTLKVSDLWSTIPEIHNWWNK